MSAVSSQAKVGLFVLIAALSLIYMTVRVGNMDTERGGYRLTVFFNVISGLEEAAHVKVAGVDAGKVEKIELVNGRVKLTLYINPNVKLYANSVASLRSMGLLGEKYVELSPGSSNRRLLRDRDTLPEVKESTDLDQLTTTLSEVATDIKSISGSLRKVLGGEKGRQSLQRILDNSDSISEELKGVLKENRSQLKEIMGNIRRLSSSLEKMVAHNRQSVDITVKHLSEVVRQINEIVKTNRAQVERAIANLERITATFDKESPKLTKNANKVMEDVQGILKENRENLQKSVAKVREASEKLDKTLASVSNISQKVERGEGTLGKLFKDETAYNSLTDGLKGLKSFFEKGKDLQIFVGVRSEYLFDESEAKTYLSLRLQPRDDKFYLVEIVDDPRGHTKTTTTKKTTTPPGTSETIKEEENQETLKFSVQIAKKFYDFTIRGGLIESTGGIGVDYEPWGEDRVKFRLEAFDLGADDPHLKFTTNFYVYERVFVNIGMDDIINNDYRSFFVGAGLLFSDQDLKSLLGGMALGAGAITN